MTVASDERVRRLQPEQPVLLTRRAICLKYGWGERTFIRWCEAGLGPPEIRPGVGRRIFYDPSDI